MDKNYIEELLLKNNIKGFKPYRFYSKTNDTINCKILDFVTEEQIKIVGSSTVFPFSTAVAEEFGRKTKYKTPIVESTGSGGGMKLFCAGNGKQHPDITNASRRIKSKEFKKCTDAGIKIIEIKVLANLGRLMIFFIATYVKKH